MEMRRKVKKIIESFDILKIILNDRAVVGEDVILIHDPPYEVKILRKEEIVIFSLGEEDVAVLSENECRIEEGHERIVEEWITALTSFGFKRFVLKNR